MGFGCESGVLVKGLGRSESLIGLCDLVVHFKLFESQPLFNVNM